MKQTQPLTFVHFISWLTLVSFSATQLLFYKVNTVYGLHVFNTFTQLQCRRNTSTKQWTKKKYCTLHFPHTSNSYWRQEGVAEWMPFLESLTKTNQSRNREENWREKYKLKTLSSYFMSSHINSTYWCLAPSIHNSEPNLSNMWIGCQKSNVCCCIFPIFSILVCFIFADAMLLLVILSALLNAHHHFARSIRVWLPYAVAADVCVLLLLLLVALNSSFYSSISLVWILMFSFSSYFY